MKVLYCGQAAYRYLPSDFAQRYDSVVTTPYLDLVEPPKMYESLHSHVEELLLAARSGFDGVMVTEHRPPVVGVPLITPVEELMDSPAGRVPPAE